jgi:Mg2+ and Co2+ transporter CorA
MPDTKKLATIWFQGIKDATSKKSLEQRLYSSNKDVVLVKLKKIIAQKREALLKKQTRIDSYETPSWSHIQAHINGQLETLEQLEDLLSFVD